MFTIGEFSKITGLSVKALRLYHEKGLIEPHLVDEKTGYRYYNHRDAEKARAVRLLKGMTLGLDEIAEILKNCSDDADAVMLLESRRDILETRIKNLKKARRNINSIINAERKAIVMTNDAINEIVEKNVPDMRIASIRWKGCYGDCGRYMGKLAKHLFRYMAGKPFNMYHDEGFKEEDADVETCVPVRADKEIKAPDDIKIRTLPGGKVVAIVHKGPYDQLGRSYEKIGAYIKQKQYCVSAPPREIYIKGPGMIFKGNPKNYLTEIQFPVSD